MSELAGAIVELERALSRAEHPLAHFSTYASGRNQDDLRRAVLDRFGTSGVHKDLLTLWAWWGGSEWTQPGLGSFEGLLPGGVRVVSLEEACELVAFYREHDNLPGQRELRLPAMATIDDLELFWCDRVPSEGQQGASVDVVHRFEAHPLARLDSVAALFAYMVTMLDERYWIEESPSDWSYVGPADLFSWLI